MLRETVTLLSKGIRREGPNNVKQEWKRVRRAKSQPESHKAMRRWQEGHVHLFFSTYASYKDKHVSYETHFALQEWLPPSLLLLLVVGSIRSKHSHCVLGFELSNKLGVPVIRKKTKS